MRTILGLAPLLLLARIALAEPVFPPGSAIGLDPPPGWTRSMRFTGFENAATGGSILLVEVPMPPGAIRQALTPDRLAGEGVVEEGRAEVTVAGRAGLLVRGAQRVGGATVAKRILALDGEGFAALVTASLPQGAPAELAAVETALAGVVLRRADAGAARDALPFRLTESGALQLRQVALNAAMLSTTDAPDPRPGTPLLVIAASLNGLVVAPADRRATAERAFRGLAGLTGLVVEGDAPVAFAGADAVLLRGHGRDSDSGAPVRVQQWLAFPAGGGTLRAIAMAPADRWDALLPAFEAVVASVRPR